jgi:hypothetical protein
MIVSLDQHVSYMIHFLVCVMRDAYFESKDVVVKKTNLTYARGYMGWKFTPAGSESYHTDGGTHEHGSLFEHVPQGSQISYQTFQELLTNREKAASYIHNALLEMYENSRSMDIGSDHKAILLITTYDRLDLTPAQWQENAQAYPNLFRDIVIQTHPELFTASLIRIVQWARSEYAYKTDNFIATLRETFFTGDPEFEMFSKLPIEQALEHITRITSLEELRGPIGSSCLGTLAYRFAFHNVDLEQIQQYLETLPCGIRAQVLHQLETVFAHASAQPHREKVQGIIDTIVTHFATSTNPLTRIVADVAQARMRITNARREIGVAHRGRAREGRLDTIGDTVLNIRHHCIPTTVSAEEEPLLPVHFSVVPMACDALVARDGAGLPQYVALDTDVDSVIQAPANVYQYVYELASLPDSMARVNLDACIAKLDEIRGLHFADTPRDVFYAQLLGTETTELPLLKQSMHKHWKQFNTNVFGMMMPLLSELEQDASIPHVSFTSMDEVLSSSEVNPFTQITYDDDFLLAQALRPEVRNMLQEELGVQLSELTFMSQVHLFRFLSTVDDVLYKRLQSVLRTRSAYAKEILEAFVGCAEDVTFGEQVLALCERSTDLELASVLHVYADVLAATAHLQHMVHASDTTHQAVIVSTMEETRVEHEVLPEIQQKYVRNLYMRARAILSMWQQAVETARAADTTLDQQPEFLERFSRQAKQVSIFAAACKALQDEKRISIFDVLNETALQTQAVKEGISKKNMQAMRGVFLENYKQFPAAVREVIIAAFEKRMSAASETILYTVESSGELVSFCTLEPMDRETTYHSRFNVEPSEHDTYFGSFNTTHVARGGAVGGMLMRKVLDDAAREDVLFADCPATLPIGARYIEGGFMATCIYDFHGAPSLEIVRNDRLVSRAKKMDQRQLVQLGQTVAGIDDPSMRVMVSKKQSDMSLSLLKNEADAVDGGYVLTRYFYDTKSACWYAVFETIDSIKEASEGEGGEA